MTAPTSWAVDAPAPGPLGRAGHAVADAWTITLRDLQHWRRQPGQLAVGLLFPVLMVVMFGYVLGGGMAVPGGGDYLEFLMPGMFAVTMLFGLEATMTAVTTDAQRGVTDRFRSMPMARSGVVAGRALADMLASTLGLAVMVACGLVVGWRANGTLAEALLALALLLWLRFAFLWLGIWIGLSTRDPGVVTAVQILVWPFAFLSNAFVPTSTMPGWMGTLAELNPMTATVAATRDLFGNPVARVDGWLAENAVLVAVLWPAVLTLVFAALSVRRWQRLER